MTPDTQTESLIANIYVDIQNLGNGTFPERTEVIKGALDNWPKDLPRVTYIHAYIDSGEEHYWKNSFRTNLTSSFPNLKIECHPVQKYNNSPTPGPNAADIALVLDALSDLMAPIPIDFAAIISNDSGFVSLYFKLVDLVRERKLRPMAQVNGIPFMLFTHDLSRLSPLIHENLGENVIHVGTKSPTSKLEATGIQDPVASPQVALPLDNQTHPTSHPAPQSTRQSLMEQYTKEQLAGAVANGIGRRHWEAAVGGVYTFTYKDVFNVIKSRWPESREATPGQHEFFSIWFRENLWPVMDRHGVTISSKPGPISGGHNYEMAWAVRESLKSLNPQGEN